MVFPCPSVSTVSDTDAFKKVPTAIAIVDYLLANDTSLPSRQSITVGQLLLVGCPAHSNSKQQDTQKSIRAAVGQCSCSSHLQNQDRCCSDNSGRPSLRLLLELLLANGKQPLLLDMFKQQQAFVLVLIPILANHDMISKNNSKIGLYL